MRNWWNSLDESAKNFIKVISLLLAGILVYKTYQKPIKVLLFLYKYGALIFLFLFSLTIHEVSHGFVAYLFGDKTAKNAGRLSLNPFKHLDVLGLLMLFIIKVGWAKPVPVNGVYLRRRKFALPLVALAGPLANLIFAFIIIGILDKLYKSQVMNLFVVTSTDILLSTLYINIYLAIFNLIPIPPLDGSRIVSYFFSEKGREIMDSLEGYGFLILLLLLWTGILTPVINYLFKYTLNLLLQVWVWIGSLMNF